MQELNDFLNFKLMISPYLLILFYYLGAIGVPIFSWIISKWIRKKYWLVSNVQDSSIEIFNKVVAKKYRFRLMVLFIMMFIFLELMWRMMFEFLIAYFQMHSALVSLG